MGIVEMHGGPVTQRYLMNKTKEDLAGEYLQVLGAIDHLRSRLAQYERDMHDDIGKDRSQDTDWLRAGFLQRGAEIERLEDGIRGLADQLDTEPPDNTLIHDDVGTVADVAGRLRGLLGEDGE